MTAAKRKRTQPLKLLLSRFCIECAGDAVLEIQRCAAREVAEVAAEARDWLLHTITVDGGVYVCQGQELSDRWEIYIQKAHYVHLTTLPEDHPDPEQWGKEISFPQADDFPSNSEFTDLPMPS